MKKFGAVAVLGLVALASDPVAVTAAEKITVGGSGSPIPMTRELARSFLAKYPGDEIEVLPSSIGEAGGLKATGEGRLQLGIIARKPEGDELKNGFSWRVYAVVPSVVVVNTSVPVTNIKEEQILGVYAGKITNWAQLGGPDARIVVLTRNEADMNKRAWRMHLKGFRDLVETKDAIMLVKAEQMLEALKNQPYSIGFTDTIAVAKGDGKLRALTINGIAPTPENAQSGRYWILKEFVVVAKAEAPGLAKRFADFLFSAEGQRIIGTFGAVPVK